MRLTRKQRERREQIGLVVEERGMERLDSSRLVDLLGETEGQTEHAAITTLVERSRSAMPALLAGLKHANRKVRATCALLLDHIADDSCIEPLRHAMRHDPYEAVRRCAMHALVCDGCKECPLHADVIGALLESLQYDRSLAVQRRAVFYLGQQPPDPRTTRALEDLLQHSTDPILRRRAATALEQHAKFGAETTP